MCAVKLFTDSTSDLSPQLIRTYNIGIVPLYVIFEEQSYRDGADILLPDLYQKVEEKGKLPKTSAPTPADFYQAFKPYVDQDDEILYIGLSSCISSTIANARLAAAELAPHKIRVIDSLNLSSGIGLLVLRAGDLLARGKSLDETEGEILAMVPKIRSSFVIDTMDYLYKGGRCSALQSIVGTLLSIKPIIKVVDGQMTVGQKARKRQNSLNAIVENTLADLELLDPNRIIVTNSMGYEDALAVRRELMQKTPAKEILLADAGCIISSHCGQNTVGVFYALR